MTKITRFEDLEYSKTFNVLSSKFNADNENRKI